MKRLTLGYVVAAIALGSASVALAQVPPCKQRSLQGVWCLTCEGFTDLSKIDPAVPPGTLVPVKMQARMVIDETGTGRGKGEGSLGGMIFLFDKEETFTMHHDCTAEKAYTLSVPALGLVLPGKAASLFMPREREIRTLILQPGDIVSCTHKKIFDGPGRH